MSNSKKIPWLRNVLALLAGLVAGSAINGFLIYLGSVLIPLPLEANAMNAEALKKSLPLFGPQHFIFPFLAHALGTLAGASLSSLLASGRTFWPAAGVGVLFFAGGIYNVATLPAPVWFSVLDLSLAYFPMAWLGWKWVLARKKS
jgi:hypothetical protein